MHAADSRLGCDHRTIRGSTAPFPRRRFCKSVPYRLDAEGAGNTQLPLPSVFYAIWSRYYRLKRLSRTHKIPLRIKDPERCPRIAMADG